MRNIAGLVVFMAVLCLCLGGAVWKRGDTYVGWWLADWVPTTAVPSADTFVRCAKSCADDSTCTGVYFDMSVRKCLQFSVNHFEFWTQNSDHVIAFFAPMDGEYS